MGEEVAAARVPSLVVVAGDVVDEWRIAIDAERHVAVSCEAVGATTVASVLQAMASGTGAIEVVPPPQPSPRDSGAGEQVWTVWARAPDNRDAWRIERTLGTAAATAPPAPATPGDDAAAPASVAVLYDAGLGYRDQPDRWPSFLDASATDGPWLVVHMGAPVVAGPLWQRLSEAARARKLVVVVAANDLRRSQVQVSRDISWERTAQDLVWELAHNDALSTLARAAHVVVSFGAAGAVVASNDYDSDTGVGDEARRFALVFDPTVMEDEWERERPGTVTGGPATLAAYVAAGLVRGTDHADVSASVVNGLAAWRTLHDRGYQLVDDRRLALPVEQLVAGAVDTRRAFEIVPVRDPARQLSRGPQASGDPARHGYWMILDEAYPDALDRVCQDVVRYGSSAVLRGAPQGRFGKLFTVDRHEIEGLRAIRGLMEEYCAQPHVDRPLSVAVFGPPGSGKSFGVTQVATSLLPGRLQKLEFNLSQFEAPHALADALHQVRDVALSDKVPLVFWDEFDTPVDGEPLGWLRHFLAPMQDGAFRVGQLVHPIGRAIFVFAGGTSSSMQEFGSGLSDTQLRAAKKPDFVSRLRGYLDVLGPNPSAAPTEFGGDRFHQLRRAILLDSLLRRKAPQLVHGGRGGAELHMDAGVLRAFLEIPRYLHGARSMEAIIDMSQLAGHASFERSCLPSESQLDLHVDGRRFLALVQRLDLSPEVVERLARAAHEVYRGSLAARGYQRGLAADEDAKVSPKLCPYDELPEQDKAQNRANVRDIPAKLARAGYVMLAARGEEASNAFAAEVIEELAKEEHERWMAEKVARGWVYGAPTDDAAKRHDALVPWEQLGDCQREKDRDFVVGMAQILSRCGYAVVRVPG